jgi:DNA polymerase III delta prime subunit
MDTSHINALKNIEKAQLFDLLRELVAKLGYKNIQTDNNLVYGIYDGPLSAHVHGFIYLDERLHASAEATAEYKVIIEGFATKYKILSIFVFSNNVISKGFQSDLKVAIPTIAVDFIGRDRLIELINEKAPEFWKHDDVRLLTYEKSYCDSIIHNNDLKKLKIFNEKYDRLLSIFVEPNYHHFYDDKETNTPIRKKVDLKHISKNQTPVILSGNAGTGKTTSLKKIGEYLINENQHALEKKNLPIFLTVTEIFEADYKLNELVDKKLKEFFVNSLSDIADTYKVSLLIDTIDELEEATQVKIINKLTGFFTEKGINFFLGSRNHEKIALTPTLKSTNKVNIYSIDKFNIEQIKQFISKFFPNEDGRAETLLDALRDNRILDKLPITPLTLSLISILYEENNLEIPATITDIYDNFNSLLLGKAIVSSRLEFIDSSFRERVLSLYALELLERQEHLPMTRDEFFQFFVDYYEDKTIPIRKGNLEDVLDYLINNTGILYLKNNKYVQFNHDSFMEYYGAIELFKHQREKENKLVDNFFDVNWQNASIFYAGKSKDMSGFLRKILEKVGSSNKLNDFYMSVMGLGYLMQALYQTDNKLRNEGVILAVNLNIKAHEVLMKLSTDDEVQFKNFKLPLFLLMNLFYFHENFNSITLKEPLSLSFTQLVNSYKESGYQTINGYKALMVAFTLNSKRVNDSKAIEELVMDTKLTNDPMLCMLTDLGLNLHSIPNYKELKKHIRKDFHKLKEPLQKLSSVPASKLRFTNYDTIRLERKITIITEGITDAQILEHAFSVLSDGDLPYWQIKPSGIESGGAAEVAKTLKSANPLITDGKKLIGIFDRDAKGLQEFNGLTKGFEIVEEKILKKQQFAEIYALCLPPIADREIYLKAKQQFNFLEIEHYFDDEVLTEYGLLKKTDLPGVFEIADKKTDFATKIRKITSPNIFKNFIQIFEKIDRICNVSIEYL